MSALRDTKGAKPNPYVSFTNDRDRLWALMSRDVRLSIIGVVSAVAASPILLWITTKWL